MDPEVLGLILMPALAVILYGLMDRLGEWPQPGEDDREVSVPIPSAMERDPVAVPDGVRAWSPSLVLLAVIAVTGVAVSSLFSTHRK
jgi:hypothetical protein